jgi:FAD synthase
MIEIPERDQTKVIYGVVTHGDQRGRTLGFPTANLVINDAGVPDGVWAGVLELDGEEPLVAAISIGRRSTFYGQDGCRLLEAHILDFNSDIYGRSVSVYLCRHLRGQSAFATTDDLVRQLEQDMRLCRDWSTTRR